MRTNTQQRTMITNIILDDWKNFNWGGSTFLSSMAKEAYLAEREKHPESKWYAERAAVAAEDEYIISLADKVRAGEALPDVCRCQQECYSEQAILRREKMVLKRLEKNEKNRMTTALRKIKIEEGKIAMLKCKEQYESAWTQAEKARTMMYEDIQLVTRRNEQALHRDTDQAYQDEIVKSLAGLPMDIANIIFEKHAVLHDRHCEELVETWINAMTKYMINGRQEDKDKADDIQHQLRNTKSAIVFNYDTHTTLSVAAHIKDYTGSLGIRKTLMYTIGVKKITQNVYRTKHEMKLPSLTQLGDPKNKNMRLEVDISCYGTNTTTSKAKMIKTAEEVFDLMEHQKPLVAYSYYADIGNPAKNVKLSLMDD